MHDPEKDPDKWQEWPYDGCGLDAALVMLLGYDVVCFMRILLGGE